MTRLLGGLLLLFGLAVPVLACGHHAEVAADDVDDWLDSSTSDNQVGDTGFGVTGKQHGNEGNNAGGWHWEWYTVTVTYPGNPGSTVTITTSGSAFGNSSNSGALEQWLANEAMNVIRQADLQSDDYIG